MSPSLLSYNGLRNIVFDGVITNVESDFINSSSIDLTLGSKVLVEEGRMYGAAQYIKLCDRKPLNMREVTLNAHEPLYIPPGGFVLAQSQQVFHLPDWLSAEYKLKSSMARIGLEHLNAGWCDAGWNGSVLTLELKNMTRHHHIGITLGDRIGQVVFFAHESVPSDRSYAARGRYNGDTEVSGIKP